MPRYCGPVLGDTGNSVKVPGQGAVIDRKVTAARRAGLWYTSVRSENVHAASKVRPSVDEVVPVSFDGSLT
jgi:hypothetical protein